MRPPKKIKNLLFETKFKELSGGIWNLEPGISLPVTKLTSAKGSYMQAFALTDVRASFVIGTLIFAPQPLPQGEAGQVQARPESSSMRDVQAASAAVPALLQTFLLSQLTSQSTQTSLSPPSGAQQDQMHSENPSMMDVQTASAAAPSSQTSLPIQLETPPSSSQILVKAYHGEIQGGWKYELLSKYMTNSLSQYRKIKAEFKLPVAEIYNESTALEQGVFLVEYISEAIDPTNPEHLAQVQRFFDCAIQHCEALDLHPSNFRVQKTTVKEKRVENGKEIEQESVVETVKLIDFKEEAEADELACEFAQILGRWIEAWRARGKTEKEILDLYATLTLNFKTLNPFLADCIIPPQSLAAFDVVAPQTVANAAYAGASCS